MLRIAILNLTGGGMSGGYKKYLKNLLPRLSLHNNIEAILCASPITLLVNTWFGPMHNVTFVDCKPYSIISRKDEKLHRELDAFKPNVIFIPMERYFKYKNTPVVCMLTNMLPLINFQYITLRETLRNRIQRTVAHIAVKKSIRVIAVSNFVSDFMQREWKIALKKIGVVYHGVRVPPDEYLVAPTTVPIEWSGNFFFTAGSIEPYRGLEDILLASRLLLHNGYNIKIVVAGSARPILKSYFRKIHELVNKFGLHQNICWAGCLNEKEMAWCYQNARAYIMSSRVEACPNTALEAMSHGCHIISTKAPPMKEIFEETAEYYEPGDEKKLASCIIDTLQNSLEFRKSSSQAAVKRALEFSWEATVEKTISELKKTISDHKNT